jgi:hypothetical protein
MTVSLTHKLQSDERPKGKVPLERLIYRHGSKVSHALVNLRNLWAKEPDAKVIIFSKVRDFGSSSNAI